MIWVTIDHLKGFGNYIAGIKVHTMELSLITYLALPITLFSVLELNPIVKISTATTIPNGRQQCKPPQSDMGNRLATKHWKQGWC